MGDYLINDNEGTTDSQSGFLKSHTLTILTVIMAASGFATGQAIRHAGWTDDVERYIDIPGQMILHCYSMLLVPVLFCGIIMGVASLHRTSCQRVVVFSGMFFVLMMGGTSIFSCVLAKQLKLGHHAHGFAYTDDNFTDFDDTDTVLDSMVDFFQNAVPENIIMATFIQKETVTTTTNVTTSEGNNTMIVERETKYKYQTNYVGLVFFCIAFGSTMAVLGNKVQTLYLVLDEVNLIIMKLLQFLVKLLPIGLFFWLCCQGIITESIVDVFSRMGFYLTVFLSVHVGYHFIVLPLLYLVIVRKNPFTFMAKICPLSMMAFGSSSSQACLPLSLKIMEDGLKCHPFVTRFVLPLGSLINMQGATLATPLTVFFIAGLQGVKIGMVKTIVLGVSNVLLQMAFPGIPGNGMTTLWFLYFVGVVKPYVIGLVLSIEWFLDRVITVNNVAGNCYVAAFVDKLSYSMLRRCRQSEGGASFLIDTGSLSSIATNSSIRPRSRGSSADTIAFQNSVY